MSAKHKPENRKTAKNKLNAAHFMGSMFVSGLIGIVSESFAVFLVALVALLAAAYHSGDIRR